MSNPDLYDLYDDEDAIAFIRKTLSPEQNKALDDDDLYNVIDLVYEYYEDHGYTNEDEDTEVLLDVDDICRYIKEIMAKDDMEPLDDDLLETLVEAELDYEDSLAGED